MTLALLIAFVLCTGAAAFVFICNAYTPLQFGPIPFFCTAIPGFCDPSRASRTHMKERTMTDEEIIKEMAEAICCEQACFNCDIADAGSRDCERAARAAFAIARARARIREQCAEEDRPIGFSHAMLIAQSGFDNWKAKPHNAKWWRRIDGTPIPNDLLVNIAEAIADAALRQPKANPDD